jgi:hypothetical protein
MPLTLSAITRTVIFGSLDALPLIVDGDPEEFKPLVGADH